MNRFPLEIVNRILEYDGRIKYRHGKYMNQIAQDDDRYTFPLRPEGPKLGNVSNREAVLHVSSTKYY